MKQYLGLVFFSLIALVSSGQSEAETIAFWGLNDNDLPGGGFGFLADPSVFPLAAELDLVGATLSVGGGITSNTIVNSNGDTVYQWLQSFAGTTVNALPGVISGGSLAVQGGTFDEEGIPQNNGAYIEFAFSMSGYENLVVSYACQRTGTGFSTHTWSWSTDGVNFSDFATVDSTAILSSFANTGVISLGILNELDDNPVAFLRLTMDGGTGPTGNNRFDNILLTADSLFPGVGASVVGSSVSHGGWTGGGSAIDTGKLLAKEGNGPQSLSFDNLINTSQGINGVIFDILDLANGNDLNADDFQFQWSPQGVFDQGENPPALWQSVTAAPTISVAAGSPDRVLIEWPSGSVVNRWLRVTLKATANTGLAEPEVYYIGHLLGETTGLSGTVYTVAFADITPIRSAVGNTANASSTVDIDKNGIVNFADISAMRSNVGAQLSNITLP